jgi:uncharacterized coiled-coil DUF342 family protein
VESLTDMRDKLMDELKALRQEKRKIMKDVDRIDTDIGEVKLKLDLTDPNRREPRGHRR